jgi:hypothetical protein
MRKLIYALIALALFTQYSCGPTHVIVESPAPQPPPPPPPAPEVSYQSFYDALSPYGQWINNPQYGYVWMPNVGPDFKPYSTNGNWVYTDGGWTWASNYPWGWATFHYGRWFFEEGYGWMWIPGTEWAPAWVSWRRSPEYYGWAPLGPSVSISASVEDGYNPPPHYWCFVPQQYVTSPHVNNYYVSEQQNVTIINNTTVIHNTTIVNNTVNNTTIVNNNVSNTRVNVNNYAGGPDPVEVSRVTGAPLRPVALRESNAPGENRTGAELAIYRPRVNAAPQGNGMSAPRPAPAHVQTLTNVRPVNATIYNNNRGNINNTNITNTTTNNTRIDNNTTNNNTNINNNNSRNTNITNNTANSTNNNTINNNNNTTNNTNNNVNNRTVVNPSNTGSSTNNRPPAGPGFNRPNTPAPGNSGAPVVQQTSSKPPATNPPSGQGYNRLPASNNAVGSGHPGQPATNPNTFKPGAPKGLTPPPQKPKTDSSRRRQN